MILILEAVALVLAVALAVAYFWVNRGPVFLKREQVVKLLRKDTDGYFARLSPADLCARGVESRQEYLQLAESLATDAPPDVREKVKRTLQGGKFAFMDGGSLYEGGFPHTRGGTIFLPISLVRNLDLERLAQTLRHEKLHISQKRYPNKFRKLLEKEGFERTVLFRDLLKQRPLLRANPDTDEWVWKDRDGKLMLVEYTSARPSNLQDVSQAADTEHPWEWMAYNIQTLKAY